MEGIGYLLYETFTHIVLLNLYSQTPTGNEHLGLSTWLPSFEIPEKFSRTTMEALTTGIVSKRARSEIVNVVAHKVLEHTERPTSEEYTTVSRMLINKHPKLKDTIGNGYVSSHICYCLVVRIYACTRYNTFSIVTPHTFMVVSIWQPQQATGFHLGGGGGGGGGGVAPPWNLFAPLDIFIFFIVSTVKEIGKGTSHSNLASFPGLHAHAFVACSSKSGGRPEQQSTYLRLDLPLIWSLSGLCIVSGTGDRKLYYCEYILA